MIITIFQCRGINVKINKTVLAGVVGNAIEWCDFTLYANFSVVFAKLFFPTHDKFVSMLITFAVFALGFLVRPLGGAVFGYLGDRFGRRQLLIISIMLMSIPTILIGLLPTYAMIGLTAPILLTFLRMLQGLAVSGELTGAATYLIEHAGDNHRGYAGSLIMFTAVAGIVVGTGIASLFTQILSVEQLYVWGWRVPFVLVGLLGFVGLKLRLASEESPGFAAAKVEQIVKNPLTDTIKYHYRGILIAAGLTGMMAIGNYFLIAYFTPLLVNQLDFTLADAVFINLCALILMAVAAPVVGILTDRVGRKPVLRSLSVIVLLSAYPVFYFLTYGSFITALCAEVFMGILTGSIAAVIPATIAELFPTTNRNSGIGLGYNISLALFGGTAPMVASMLAHYSGHIHAPAFYYIASAVLVLFLLTKFRDRYQDRLQDI